MGFEQWRSWSELIFLPMDTTEYVALAIYVLISVGLLIRYRGDFLRIGDWKRLPLFLLLLISPFLTNHLLLLNFPASHLLSPPGVPVSPIPPFAPLLGAVPIFIAGVWLGAGPALLIGIVVGVLRTGMSRGGPLEVFYFGGYAFLVGLFLHQSYRGRFPYVMRQPAVAGPISVLLASLIQLLSVFIQSSEAGIAGVDYAVTYTGATLPPMLIEVVVASVLFQALYLLFPHIHPVRVARQHPPYSRTLSRRLLSLFVPLILLMTLMLIFAVSTTILDIAVDDAFDEMARDANGAAEYIPYFIHTGQGLLAEFAQDERLGQEGTQTSEDLLGRDVRAVAFFDQLMLFDAEGNLVALYPPVPAGDPTLTDEESRLLQRVFTSGAPQISAVHRSGRDEPIISFIVPWEDVRVEGRYGALIGRTRLEINPVLRLALTSLQWTRARGEGFFLDDQGQIVAHSDPDMLLAKWYGETGKNCLPSVWKGCAYQSANPVDNTRELVYYLPVEGYPWGVVIRLPYEVVLEQATRIAAPLLILQLLLGGVLIIVIPLVTNVVTRPLTQLAAAASRIAEGNLDHPVYVPGTDEVARVGEAFEGMRVRLKNRLEDLSLLLQVSQAVSATLELPKGMPFILEGALKATQAQVARIVLLSADGDPQIVIARGEPREGLGGLDRAFAAAARGLTSPLLIDNLARARTLVDPEAISPPLKAAIALPIRTKDQVPGVMWVGYRTVRQFEASEVDLLSTLASQTAVLVENARLFQAAEGGRQRLAAILSSTNDAILVTDRDDRLLLVNPAAERAFGIVAEAVIGKKATEMDLAPALMKILSEPLEQDQAITEEVPLPDGRTLYASVSMILSADGERMGRVAVMRDVTYFKELDEMKSDFVATVSHDLRAPLTFMRGYTTMLPMVGDLSEKQREYVDKILQGVTQMSELIDDLLDLGRIEAGIGLERQPCHLGTIMVEAVDGMRARAAAKGLTLRLEPAEEVPIVAGDAALLRQAISNLVDNAVKYTSTGGTVTVGLAVRGDTAVIRVADTGIGISPDDQVRLFEKFYRVKRRDTASIQGTGLGLAIVKSIVERHGGKVWVDSELNRGSTFYIGLPIGPPTSEEDMRP